VTLSLGITVEPDVVAASAREDLARMPDTGGDTTLLLLLGLLLVAVGGAALRRRDVPPGV